MNFYHHLCENFQNFLNEDFSLDQFAQEVFKAISIQAKSNILKKKNFFGDDRVFIEPTFNVYDQMFPHSPASNDLGTFKKFLVRANQQGLLRLSRADLVPAMNPQMVQGSETNYLNASFHFIEVPTSLEEADFQTNVKKNHTKKKKVLIGLGKNKDKTWKPLKKFKRAKSAPPDFGTGDPGLGDFSI